MRGDLDDDARAKTRAKTREDAREDARYILGHGSRPLVPRLLDVATIARAGGERFR